MKHKKTLFLVAFIAVLITALGFQTSPEYKILFEKAKFTMETKGDLNGAINLFNDIIKKYPKEREYAAKSQLYIGLCYEKLGTAEARKAYESVVREYADQSEIVAQARVRLAALGGPGGTRGLVTRRVLTDASGVGEMLTPDGKYIIGIDWETGNVNQFEVASGQTNRITNKGHWSETEKSGENYSFISNGKQIAYVTEVLSDAKVWVFPLRIRNLDGSGFRTLCTNDKDSYVSLLEWSPDARSILAVRTQNNVDELVLISTKDGSMRDLRSITSDWIGLLMAKFSPDGQFVAFSQVREGSSPHSDILLMTADGRNEVVVAGHPSEDQLLRWTPDGRSLVFLSDRSGTWDIWIVHITGGKQQGEPELLKKDFGYNVWEILGFTPNGSLYYKTQTSSGRLYFGAVDLETGKILVPPAPVTTRYTGLPSQPTWSPDGRNLLYLSSRGTVGPGNNILTIRSAATGEERFLSPRLRFVNQMSWAPDSRSVIALGITMGTETGIFRIDTETSGITKLADIGLCPKLCPDGKTLVFSGNGPSIMKRNLDTGEESEVVKGGTMFYDLSPDGREVVFQLEGAIKTVSLDGGEPREIFRGPVRPAWYYGLRWTRDGRYIIARARGTESNEILLVPSQGGTPLKLDLSIPKIESFT
ncbi:MAG: PD40 domain-containing protein, partial [Thermoplasmata archaeon]|nr:PD40 domain-containing protein [Thermoplasmata archaeon]